MATDGGIRVAIGGLAQQRAETVKNGGDPDVQTFEAAKQIEHLQKQQAAERKTLASSLPLVPTLREFLEPRAEHDPVAARLLEQEKRRDPAQQSIRGRRTAAMEPEVLDGLTHDIEDGPPKCVHYARDGERVMTDRGERVDLYHVDDREIEAALRLAEQKYDMDKGLQLNGSREFQQRAAEIAGRMGLKVQNPELQQTWQLGRLQTLQSEELGADTRLTAPAVGKGSVEAARADHGGDRRAYTVDAQAMQAEALLGKLDIRGFDALDRASRDQPLTPEQRIQLQGHDDQTRLIDDQDRLTPLGERVTERMWAKIETEREQLQQQLRTRNIDEELKKREAQEQKQERTEEKAQEKIVEREIATHERAEEREVEAPQRAPVRSRPRQPSRDMSLGG
ncbi:LPD7 domain-containing protein [Thiomonas sp. Sup16B3]|uniref:LPD7 domain-containing protein n=1 Tax=Thiomonas sp. Sup16B3 TaxID=2493109 RepID=UPI0012A93BD5